MLSTRPVPRLWPDSTIVCVGSGPSLDAWDVQSCYDRGAKILAVNDAYRLCGGKLDALYAAEQKWWGWNDPVGNQQGKPFKFSLDPKVITHPPKYMQYVHLLTPTGERGLELDPAGVRHGGHSGYAAVNLALHLGAKRILLLGYDMMPSHSGLHHFFGDHPDGTHLAYDARRLLYPDLYKALAAYDVELLNVTRVSRIEGVPRADLLGVLLGV